MLGLYGVHIRKISGDTLSCQRVFSGAYEDYMGVVSGAYGRCTGGCIGVFSGTYGDCMGVVSGAYGRRMGGVWEVFSGAYGSVLRCVWGVYGRECFRLPMGVYRSVLGCIWGLYGSDFGHFPGAPQVLRESFCRMGGVFLPSSKLSSAHLCSTDRPLSPAWSSE
jgi:hypothetical protein